jgi:23S rRNA (uracil1939-C5)-methyltransferase
MVPGGDGFARLPDGKAVFVSGAYTNECVDIELIINKKDYAKAVVTRIIQASPHRVHPFCRYFGRCGGCQWQDIDYAEQVRIKKQIVQEIWQRQHLLLPADFEVIASDHPQEGRHRVQLHHQDQNWGFMAKYSNDMVAIKDCPMLAPPIRQFLHKPTHIKNKSRVNVFSNEHTCYVEGRDKKAFVEVASKHFNLAPDIFFQNHLSLLPQLLQYVLKDVKGKVAYDLYSGVGFFATFLEDHFDQVFACEENDKVLPFIKDNTIKTQFVAMSTEKFLQQKNLPAADLIMIDPPRTGLSQNVLQALLALRAHSLIYISCDAPSQARDLKQLEALYHIDAVQAFDFYPQTAHIEMVTKLTLHAERIN